MTYRLFLDDERQPLTMDDFVVVRSYDEFCFWILNEGLPSYISFDHDLGTKETGLDCAKFLIEYCISRDIDPGSFDYYVHSQNPIGKANIEGLLEGFKGFRARLAQ